MEEHVFYQTAASAAKLTSGMAANVSKDVGQVLTKQQESLIFLMEMSTKLIKLAESPAT